MSATRADVVAAARAYLGVPWIHQGRSRAGLDCGGLIVCVAHDLGLWADFDVSGYGREPDGAMLRQHLERQATRVLEHALGDILLLRFVRLPQHLAICTELGIIHTYAQVGAVVEHRLDAIWRARIVNAYAYPGLAPAPAG
jgi:cell wall-associated NlpC family hydrolase